MMGARGLVTDFHTGKVVAPPAKAPWPTFPTPGPVMSFLHTRLVLDVGGVA